MRQCDVLESSGIAWFGVKPCIFGVVSLSRFTSVSFVFAGVWLSCTMCILDDKVRSRSSCTIGGYETRCFHVRVGIYACLREVARILMFGIHHIYIRLCFVENIFVSLD